MAADLSPIILLTDSTFSLWQASILPAYLQIKTFHRNQYFQKLSTLKSKSSNDSRRNIYYLRLLVWCKTVTFTTCIWKAESVQFNNSLLLFHLSSFFVFFSGFFKEWQRNCKRCQRGKNRKVKLELWAQIAWTENI